VNVVPLPIARTSSNYQSTFLLSTLQTSQLALMKVETQLSTGQRLTQSSDDPAATVGIMGLNQQISNLNQGVTNLKYAQGFLSTADSTLGTVTNLLTQAQSVASSMVQTTASSDQRQAQASVIDSLISQVVGLANTRYQGAAVFGGANGVSDPFAAVDGGYTYQGSTGSQNVSVNDNQTISYTVDGSAVFGGLSAQVAGYQSLDPALTADTPLADLQGVNGGGVTPGKITISSGGTSVNVDLSGAVTVGDVTSGIQAALTGAGLSATVTTSGDHFVINNAAGTDPLTIADQAGSTMAAQLSLGATVAAGGIFGTGSPQAAVTLTTPLSSLRGGAGLDPSGFVITNGALSATIKPGGLNTVEDLLNAINGSGTQVRAQINSAGTGINVSNALSGSELTIGENGGATADQLGIRSFQPTTQLSSLNNGTGITPISQSVAPPAGQIVVTCTDGSSFNVDISGATTPADIIAKINSASGNTTVTAAASATGNGITLTDTSGGAGNISITAGANYQPNGSTLNLLGTGTGGTFASGNMTFSTDDLEIVRRDGSWFTVNTTGLSTVQDVLNAINNAAGNTNPATQVVAGLNSTGNGISLTDPTTGGTLQVQALNASPVAAQLGLNTTAASGAPGVIHGTDVNGVSPSGVLSSLIALRNALNANNTAGIQAAATSLQQNSQTVTTAQGVVGAREQDIQSRLTQSSNEQVALQSSLSQLADTDMTTAITQFQALQTAYEASLKVAASTQNMSLLDFLQ
jgi:flagellar hook-associated protein 3